MLTFASFTDEMYCLGYDIRALVCVIIYLET